MSDTVISIRNLYKVFGEDLPNAMTLVHDGIGKDELQTRTGNVIGLSDINLDIERRKIQVVMGLSGSGKSTLIRHLNRLIDPTEGEIEVDGKDIMAYDEKDLLAFRRHSISMVFQRFALFPHRTVLENVGFGLETQQRPKAEIKTRVLHWIDRVGLAGYEDTFPGQLSGGMQQRVGLARALATDAEILLMDEAFSALDPLIRAEMQTILLDLQEELHKTIIFITHDLDEALRMGDRIAILRDGKIIQNDDPQTIIMRPADDYVADFMKDINRARVLRAGSIMTTLRGSETGPKIDASMILEDVAQVMAKTPDKAGIVINKQGEPTGRLTIAGVIESMARPDSTGTRIT
ncbi:MAG: quaternary amine ABC transporter ATP-binding protein [Alphaproteobacteria bacterium]